MKATFTPPPPSLGTNRFKTSDRAEAHFRGSMIVVDADLMHDDDLIRPYEVITVRFYDTPSRSRACVWVYRRNPDGEVTVRGSGSAGGGGYHRRSAALEEALAGAGFRLDSPVEGRGEPAMRAALLACASAVGVLRPRIVEAFP